MLNLLMTKIALNLKFIHAKSLKLQIQLLLIVGFIHYIYKLLKERQQITFKFPVIAKQLNLNVPRDIEKKSKDSYSCQPN